MTDLSSGGDGGSLLLAGRWRMAGLDKARSAATAAAAEQKPRHFVGRRGKCYGPDHRTAAAAAADTQRE